MITIMPFTDICFCSLSMRILFNGISHMVLRWYFAIPIACENLSSGFKSGMNRMVLCAMVYSCLLVKRRKLIRSCSVLNCRKACVIVFFGHCVSSRLFFIACFLITSCKKNHPPPLRRSLWLRHGLTSARPLCDFTRMVISHCVQLRRFFSVLLQMRSRSRRTFHLPAQNMNCFLVSS